MREGIHIDVVGLHGVTQSLQEISDHRGGAGDEFDLSGAFSDLVTSGAEMFTAVWSDAHRILEFTSGSLASGVDDTARDFLAAERDHVGALTAFIEALEVR